MAKRLHHMRAVDQCGYEPMNTRVASHRLPRIAVNDGSFAGWPETRYIRHLISLDFQEFSPIKTQFLYGTTAVCSADIMDGQ